MRIKEEGRGQPGLKRGGGANSAKLLTNIVPFAIVRGQRSGEESCPRLEARRQKPPGVLDDRTWIAIVERLLRLDPETFEQIVLAVRLERRFDEGRIRTDALCGP